MKEIKNKKRIAGTIEINLIGEDFQPKKNPIQEFYKIDKKTGAKDVVDWSSEKGEIIFDSHPEQLVFPINRSFINALGAEVRTTEKLDAPEILTLPKEQCLNNTSADYTLASYILHNGSTDYAIYWKSGDQYFSRYRDGGKNLIFKEYFLERVKLADQLKYTRI